MALRRNGAEGYALGPSRHCSARPPAARPCTSSGPGRAAGGLAEPPYRPEPGQPVYQISAGGHAAQVAEKELAGPLHELAGAVLSEGSHG